VYYDSQSMNSVRVIVYLKEAGIPFDLVKINLTKGDHKSPEILKLNPRGQVPFLVHDSIQLNESVAIIEYFGRIQPNESLFPIKDHALCSMNCRLIAEFHQKLDTKHILGSVVWGKKTRAEIEDRVTALFKELEIWEGYLAHGNDYFLGDSIATSDMIVFPDVATCFWLLGLPEKDFPLLAAWYHRMRARPSVASLDFWGSVEPKPEWRVFEAPKL